MRLYYIGIDLGGTGIKVGIVDEHYNIVGRGEAPTNMPRPVSDIMDDIAALCVDTAQKLDISMDDIGAIGIGSPGSINTSTGILEFSGNLNAHNFPMEKELTARLGKRVIIENDANAAAYGEAIAGAAKGARNAICITLGTGVGSGIIIDGKIFSGTNYAGAEFGHTVIVFGGEQCNCGRRGCIERYASATGLINQTIDAMKSHPESAMWSVAGDISNVNGLTAFDAIRAGDDVARAVVDRYIEYVACGVVNMVNLFQPDVVCIGGGISKEGETLLAPLRDILERERFSRYSQKQARLVAATLGNDA
ncbi:MAG: ROK family protein, partial [Clostridia bacterium]|nr:ROK family protein [Clostridia bacterium]